MNRRILGCLLVLVAVLPVWADTETDSMSTDQLFERARSFAFDGRRVEARELLYTVLERSPDYYEVRVFLGRVYAWDKDYSNARVSLERVLAARPGHTDARTALVDVELWSGNYADAERQADLGLGFAPGDPDLLFRKARAQHRLGQSSDAASTAELALSGHPGRSDIRRLYYRILDDILPNKITVAYGYEEFNDIDEWQRSTFSYRRSFQPISVIGRVNWARRFADTGTQFEIDAYPGLLRKTYAYLNLGYSTSKLYPDWRYGAEVYHNFPKSWEASLGARHLDFGASDVTIYTGSVAKYVGNWWIALRPNYVPRDTGDSYSGGIQMRRFLRGRYEYFEFIARGSISRPAAFPVTEVRDELDATLRFEIRKRITKKLLFRGGAGVRREELDSGTTRESWFLATGLDALF